MEKLLEIMLYVTKIKLGEAGGQGHIIKILQTRGKPAWTLSKCLFPN